jgi:hypothetical protein
MGDAGRRSTLQALGAFRLLSGLIALGAAAVTLIPAWLSFEGDSFSQLGLLLDDDHEGLRPYSMLMLLTLSLAGALMASAVGGDHLSELHSAFARACFFAVAAYAGLGSLYPSLIFSNELFPGTVREGAVLNIVFASAGVGLSCVSAALAQRLPESSQPRVLPTALAGAAWGMLLLWIANDVSIVAESVGSGLFPDDLRRDAWLVRAAVDGTMLAMGLAPIMVYAVIPQRSTPLPQMPVGRGGGAKPGGAAAVVQPSDAYVAAMFGSGSAAAISAPQSSAIAGRCVDCGGSFAARWMRVAPRGQTCAMCLGLASI